MIGGYAQLHRSVLASHGGAIKVPSGKIGNPTAGPFQPACVLGSHGVIAEVAYQITGEISSGSVGPIVERLQVQGRAKFVTATVGTTATGDSPVTLQPGEWLLLPVVVACHDLIQAGRVGDIIVDRHVHGKTAIGIPGHCRVIEGTGKDAGSIALEGRDQLSTLNHRVYGSTGAVEFSVTFIEVVKGSSMGGAVGLIDLEKGGH